MPPHEERGFRFESVKISPAMNHWVLVDFLNAFEDPFLQINQGSNPDVPKKGPAHLGKEGSHQIELGSMLGRVHINESVAPGFEIRAGFLGDMGGVVVQDHPDLGFRRIIVIHFLLESDIPQVEF